MSAGYFPSNDDQFNTWMTAFDAYLDLHFAEFGLTAADSDLIHNQLLPPFKAALSTHQAAQTAARTATTAKNDARAELETGARSIIARIIAYPATDAERDALGLPARNSGGLAMGVEFGEEKPLAIIDISTRLQHTMRVQTVTATGTKRGRPAGTTGAEVWRKVGEAPVGTQGMEYVGLATGGPFLIQYPAEDAGKTAHYALRWVGGKGVPGAWSETESATIAA
jgi:hypothetical protein